MKSTHLNTYCTGGAAKACRRIVAALNKAGTESKMLVLYKTNDDPDIIDLREEYSLIKNYKLKFTNKKFTLQHESEFGNREELFSSYQPVWKAEEHSLVLNSDVINLHWVSGFVNFPSCLQALHKKVVITLHDHFPFSGGYHYPNPYFRSEKFQKAIAANLKMLSQIYSASNVHFVGPSHYIIDQMTKVLGSGFKGSVIRNPVDSKVFYTKDVAGLRTRLGYKPEDKIVLFVNEKEGYKRKGAEVFISMLPGILELGYKVVLIGEKTSRIQNATVNQVGYIHSDEELREYYNLADLFVCTSLDDNLPNVISESNCCGTPVIAFATGGIPEMIEEGMNGFLIPKFDEKMYLLRMKEFQKGSFNRKKISAKAHEVYAEATAAKKYNDIYRNG